MAMQGKGRMLGAVMLGAILGSVGGVALAQGMGPGGGMSMEMRPGMMGMDDMPGGGRMGGFDHGRMLERFDSDGDGSVSRDEMRAHRAERFSGFDGDGDGSVTRDEIVGAMQARMAERFGRMADRMIALQDADGDGTIASHQFGRIDRMEMMFQRLDHDGDGKISADEAEKAERHGRGMDDGRSAGHGHGYHARGGAERGGHGYGHGHGHGHGNWNGDDRRDDD